VRGERVDRVVQVVGRAADVAAGGGEGARDDVDRKPAGVVRVLAVHDEREGAELLLAALARCARRGLDPHPARKVGAAHHLAVPQQAQLRRGLRGGEAIGEPVAAAAEIEAQDEPGLVRGAAPHPRPEAEPAVEAAQRRRAALVMVQQRVPEQRSVAEDPDVLAGADPRQHALN
jgi:hypothetical protein